ncbi:MAG: acyl-CoA dehydrogenase [Sphingomonadales bacterium BRH_c3]|nr:MAG: acyl-CoA dehydrogenase [Sphingomonadales bacterium BRH_c3]
MALHLSAADEAFQNEVREFLAENLTDDLRLAGRMCAGMYCDRPIAQRWLAILNERGWATPGWPMEYGGQDWSDVQHYVFKSELTAADAPPITPNATGMLGPVLMAFGTPTQKERYLPHIPTGEDWWAQGFSEPGAGSDLARLQCRAVRDGDGYVLNGSKIWTSHAHWSNRMFALVRTSTEGKPQAGISFMVFDLDLPGISIRPIITLSGDHEVNEVFFDNVRIPLDALVGEENGGWGVAKYLLNHERGNIYAPRLWRRVRRLKTILAAQARSDVGSAQRLGRKIAATILEVEVVEATEHRIISALSQGERRSADSSMLKLMGTELIQKLDELEVELASIYAIPDQGDAVRDLRPDRAIGPVDSVSTMSRYFNFRACTIYAGSSEVQRNILSNLLLSA